MHYMNTLAASTVTAHLFRTPGGRRRRPCRLARAPHCPAAASAWTAARRPRAARRRARACAAHQSRPPRRAPARAPRRAALRRPLAPAGCPSGRPWPSPGRPAGPRSIRKRRGVTTARPVRSLARRRGLRLEPLLRCLQQLRRPAEQVHRIGRRRSTRHAPQRRRPCWLTEEKVAAMETRVLVDHAQPSVSICSSLQAMHGATPR